MAPVPGDEICFEDKASLSSLRALLNKWNPCWKHQEMCRWWTTWTLCNDSFFFLFFFKEMLGLSRALHSWRASWFHTRQESCLDKPPAVSPSTPSLPQETTTALKSTSGEGWVLRRVIWSDGSQRRSHFGSKPYWKNTHWLGLSVPLGSHYNWPRNTASCTST